MFRPATSVVSTLSGFVANGRQTLHHVSFSPSKIPYGGFSPVRLQTELAPGHLRCLAAYRPAAVLWALPGVAPQGNRRTESACGQGPSGPFGPEALGSASGCSVPLRHRLLWPHPSFSALPASLWFSLSGLCLFTARAEKVPDLSCVSVDPCRLPYPGGPGRG
jgi:hypothetical protein